MIEPGSLRRATWIRRRVRIRPMWTIFENFTVSQERPQLLLRAPFVFEVSDEVAGVILADRQHAAFGPRQGPSFVGVDFKRKKVEIE